MKHTNQKEYWKSKWETSENKPANKFARKGMKVTAIDSSKSGIEKLKREINEKNIGIKLMDIRKWNFRNNSFDVIYAHLILQYFDDKTTTQIFRKIHKILKKTGLFFVKCKSTDDALYGKGKKIGKICIFLTTTLGTFLI